MLPEIITLNKTLECRLEEYEQLFDGVEISTSEVTEVWRSIFVDFFIIGVGWQAVWVLSEKNCKKYNVVHPTAVIVKVEDFSWHELAANVQVLAVQEDIVIPSDLEVPIIELYPIKDQDYDEYDLRSIEDSIDKCRYFFRNLWYPWDAERDVSFMDWCEAHLKNRLQMQYDLKNGVFHKTITNYLKSLLAEAHNASEFSEDNRSHEDDRLTAVKRYIRKEKIKTELDLFEEPYLRYGMILLKKEEKHIKSFFDDPEIIFVWFKGNMESLTKYLKIVESINYNNLPIKVLNSLQEAVDSSSANDIIILPPGNHALTSLKGLNSSVVIRGLNMDSTIITHDTKTISKAILLECFGLIELDNLTISKPNRIAIQVYTGILKLKNCKIISTEKDSYSRGIVVASGSKLNIEDCEIRGFGTGIALQSETQTSITNTEIVDCYEGIKVRENAALTLDEVHISSWHTFGMQLESSKFDSDIPLIGDLNLLNNSNFDIKANNVTLKGVGKGDVVIKKLESVMNFDDSEFESDEVIIISDVDSAGEGAD